MTKQTTETDAQVPAMPRLKTRALSSTRRYWKALHTSGHYAKLTDVDRWHVEVLLQLIDYMNRTDDLAKRFRLLDLVRLYERDLGLQSEPPRPTPRARDRGRPAPASADAGAEDELSALA